ncbi:hypothetical protein QVD17_27963 [Tagetes erecta]|uniref:Uncharacterized protein n=1 Tax=Tagetes erecta TaxID=13708 RepID=A0AAD8NSA1_TARER|nr:hypothetical protein QVD17_27963 [Tagetes erecta]
MERTCYVNKITQVKCIPPPDQDTIGAQNSLNKFNPLQFYQHPFNFSPEWEQLVKQSTDHSPTRISRGNLIGHQKNLGFP